ncbi:rhodanese-like domain-containing protein [Thermithiobacillus plumbiphilus]|uniref:Rhodanese-like domain-containing protein n=1 Tax=Thermithiobacillus plumbiphilus TaxID=1729899 RepID=A0ABU9D5G5_9PROT
MATSLMYEGPCSVQERPAKMENKLVNTFTPHEAWEFQKANSKAILVDVRSCVEFLFVGHSVGAINIAWRDDPDWEINPNFVADVLSRAQGRQDIAVLLICRSGHRSMEAGLALCEAGFTQVYNIAEGFEGDLDGQNHRSTLGGWRFLGLPWEQC